MTEWRCALCECPPGPHTKRDGISKVCRWCRGELKRQGMRYCGTCTKKVVEAEYDTVRNRCRDCRRAYERKRYQTSEARQAWRRAYWQRYYQEHHARYLARFAEKRRRAKLAIWDGIRARIAG